MRHKLSQDPGSLNDGLLAAVIGGFRRYHERFGAPIDKLTVGFPISLRNQDDPLCISARELRASGPADVGGGGPGPILGVGGC
jgi:hypothetical protein